MKQFLDYASSKYYVGEPVISDAEFDELCTKYNYLPLGIKVDVTRAIPHTFPMYSLQKCFVGQKTIELPGEVIETPKLDGAAVSLLYIDGNLVMALTRGDGKAGLDITDKMKTLVPTSIPIKDLIQITGEVVAPKEIPNSRNYAAGALNLKSLDDFGQRNIQFVAYGVQPSFNTLWTQDMSMLHEIGFRDINGLGHVLEKQYPTDGRVFRANDNEVFNKLGHTSKHPRGAYALKTISEGVITTLKDVIWQVGRSGVVAPVAILEPIKIEDALISKATLHNFKYIQDLNLEIGCQVRIIRSGDIIPRVVERVYDNSN